MCEMRSGMAAHKAVMKERGHFDIECLTALCNTLVKYQFDRLLERLRLNSPHHLE